jgi:hypothetical protein
MTALTLYLNETASTTNSTADQLLENASTGGSLSNKNTNLTSGTTGWVTIYGQGNASAQTGAGSQPALGDNGWIDDATTLQTNHLNSGTWTFALGFETTTSGTFVADFHFRFFQRTSGGSRTLIGEAIASSQTIISGSYTVLTPSISASASATFATGDRLGLDVTANITTNGTTGNLRMQASSSATLGNVNAEMVTAGYSSVTTSSRTIPATAALITTTSRTIPSTAALITTNSRTIPATAALLTTNSRTIPATADIALTNSRTIPATAAIILTHSRTIPATAALLTTNSRTIPATAALTHTFARVIPASATLYVPATFYASNVAQAVGGLTQSDQMSTVIGGTETSVTVTMPSSGTNSYVELTSQGGTPTATLTLPSPTGKGWSIPLQGYTFCAGNYWANWTLAKGGSSMSSATLIVRYSRRTMDGTCYPIAISTLTGQTFSTKATYLLPTQNTNKPYQFISGDTFYVDVFVYNGSTAWSSDVFTVYVSNSATQGVTNDGEVFAPQILQTATGLTYLCGIPNFQTLSALPISNQAFNLADALDQRSVVTLTGEDAPGTTSTPRGTPVILSDSAQGLLYTGNVQSDEMTKVTVGSNTQIEHNHVDHDNHYWFDKNPNMTNYANWYAGDVVCDFLQKLAVEGVTGQYAIESDYTPATFGQGTLSGTVATTTTTPFVYAPNVATPPITTNTGDLELTRAGTQFMLTEQTTSDFASGTLTNMTASSNALKPTTQKAIKFQVQYPSGIVSSNQAAFVLSNVDFNEIIYDYCRAEIWSGSMAVATNDTFYYDIWVASSSPAIMASIDIQFSDGTLLQNLVYETLDSQTAGVAVFDQNGVTADVLTDLSNYAKDAWYTRQIPLSVANGKTISQISLLISGSSAGAYTIYTKNIYLGSQSGSPFFSTTSTTTQVSPTPITSSGGYASPTGFTTIVDVFLPSASTRISPAHSISSVGLVQNSTIAWTASLPTSGTAAPTYPPGSGANVSAASSSTTPQMNIYISYDAVTWLLCGNQQALPGIPPGANVSGTSFYLKEQFQAGNDPSAIPELLQVNITINSAAAQTTSDITAAYGNTTAWNTGTYSATTTNSNGQLINGGTYTPNWSGGTFNHILATVGSHWNLTFSSGTMTLSDTGDSGNNQANVWFTEVRPLANGIIECDMSSSSSGTNQWSMTGLVYRAGAWNAGIPGGSSGNTAYLPLMSGYVLYIQADTVNSTMFVELATMNPTSAGTSIATYGTTISQGTFYHLKVVFQYNRHTIYFNHGATPIIDIVDNTYLAGGVVGAYTNGTNGGSTNSDSTAKWKNYTLTPLGSGTWESSSISLSSLGTCGYTQINWSEIGFSGYNQSTAFVLASLDGGTTWTQCTNGAEIPQLPVGTSTTGKSLLLQIVLYNTNTYLTTPTITGLYARICGNYGTVSGTRISPVLNLSPVTYESSSNVMYNSNTPAGTSVAVATTINAGSSWEAVANSGAGAALSYWTPRPSPTQDLFSTNTLANYTNTNKTGGSAASVLYTTAQSQLSLTGGSFGLYLSNAPTSVGDVEVACCVQQSDTGGLVWHYVDASNYYELVVYDATSSGGSQNAVQIYKISSNVRTLLGTTSIVFTRGTFHIPKIVMKGGLINAYFDGQCLISYLDTSPLASGLAGLRNSGGSALFYQLWIQPLGTNLSGAGLQTKVTLSTSDPSQMPQLFVLACAVRGPHIVQGQQQNQLHPLTVPFAAYYSSEMDVLTQSDGDSFWYVDRYGECYFQSRYARLGAFPLQTNFDPANASGSLLYTPPLKVTTASDTFRNQQAVTNVTTLITPPIEYKVADGTTTSWTLGYPVHSAPIITFITSGQYATVGQQGIDNGRQIYWQPGSNSLSYDSSLPVLPDGTIFSVQYVGQSVSNLIINNTASQVERQIAEGNSGVVAEIESALRATTIGMTTAQATTFANGLLNRNGINNAIEVLGTTMYGGLKPGTFVPVFAPEFGVWNAQLPIIKVTTTALPAATGLPVYQYLVDATNGANQSQWQRVFGIA